MPFAELAYRVLVADDDRHSRESLVSLLDHEGFRTLPVDGGEAAVEMLRALFGWKSREQPPVHFLVLDYNMPDLTGLEVIRRVRTELRIFLPSIMVSGQSSADLEQSVREAGGFALVPKPVEPVPFRTLLKRLVKVLEPNG